MNIAILSPLTFSFGNCENALSIHKADLGMIKRLIMG